MVSGVWISCVAVSAKALSEIDVGRLLGVWEAMLESQMVGGFHRFWHSYESHCEEYWFCGFRVQNDSKGSRQEAPHYP